MKHFLITFLALGLCFDSLWAMSLETRHINKKIDIQASIADVWQALPQSKVLILFLEMMPG